MRERESKSEQASRGRGGRRGRERLSGRLPDEHGA